MNDSSKIRNFCIIAHIDHGKSTLADRFLELTKTVDKRVMKEQVLDQMELERERGITIKLQPVRMDYNDYVLNLIDTPGHVDFSYEVSRSLAAVEGAILLVDAAQGVQAQTLANLYLAHAQKLTIIPVINKIDLPAAQVDLVTDELISILGCTKEDIYLISAKTGQGVQELLEAVCEKVPLPKVEKDKELKALIFDSSFDEYRGVIVYVRLFSGSIKPGQQIKFIATKKTVDVLEIGVFKPHLVPTESLSAGEIGYVVTGLKEISHARVGDTLALPSETKALSGYKEMEPMVFASLFCKNGKDFPVLRKSLEKLKLSDAALTFEPERSTVLGFGFRCGFLGMLHLEIVQERLKREYDLDLIITVPSVAYKVILQSKKEVVVHSPLELPDPNLISLVQEPYIKLDIITPEEYIGQIMALAQERRGEYQNTEYLSKDSKGAASRRVILHYQMPLTSILVDFYDKLKSVSSGYASLNYQFIDYQETEIQRLDILVAEDRVDALSSIVYKDSAYPVARKIVQSLKDILPRQQFEVKIQAALGGKVIAAERLSALRKDVTAKLYGGDVTRKRKLLEKQKKGKKRMKAMGKVDIPSEAFLAILKR